MTLVYKSRDTEFIIYDSKRDSASGRFLVE